MGFGVIESVLLEDLEHHESRERGFILVPQPPIHRQIRSKRRPMALHNIFSNKPKLKQNKTKPPTTPPTPTSCSCHGEISR